MIVMIKAQINNKELEEYLEKLPKDDMVVFTMGDGRIRGAVFGGTHFVNTMRAQHNTGILETYILGQASLCGALMIPAKMKGMEHINWRYDVPDSPAKGFNVEADSRGWVRSFLLTDRIPIEKPLENWDMKPFLGGEGYMSIQTVHPDDKFPQTSSVNTTGNIADDLVFFFDKSEQIKSAVTTSIQMDRQGRVIGAGGIFVQVMPVTGGQYKGEKKKGAEVDTSADKDEDEEIIIKLEETFKKAPSLGTWFSQGHTAEELIQELFADLNPVIALHRDIKWECPCSRESFINYMGTLPAEELEDIKAKGEELEVKCNNCGSVYRIKPEEIIIKKTASGAE